MRRQNFLIFAGTISAFTPKCIQNASFTSLSSFSLQLDSYFETNPRNHCYTYNRAIDTLMKFGSINSALKLFDEMTTRDVITWNILIAGHKRYGFSKEALHLYTQMVSEGFIESSSTFSTILSVCSDAGLYQEGLQVHSRVIVLGLSMNVYVGSALVDLYMNLGLVNFALKLFDDLPEKTVVAWNQLLRGFGELGRSKELLGLYSRMKKEGVAPNPLSFCYLIRGFSNERFIDEGKELHCYVIKMGWSESNLFVSNALVDFYSSCESLIDAKRSFEGIPMEDVISWNSLVSIYARNGFTSNALEIFSMMQLWGKKPSIRSFVGLLNLCSLNKDLILGKQIHSFVLKLGFDYANSYVQSALIDMYGKSGKIESSVLIYQSVPIRSLEVCNSLMTSFAFCDIVEDVIELFGLMIDEGIGFDEVSLSTTVNALPMASCGSFTSCKLLHNCAIKSGLEHDLAVSCSLIDSYSIFGHIKFSCLVFEQISSPNVICFTSIIKAHSRNKMGIQCLELLESMTKEGLKPDKVTFLCVLTACKHSGLVEEGKRVFDSMKSQHGVEPEARHLACMVDLLGRKGLLEEAKNLLNRAPVRDEYVLWNLLLRHCRVQRNEEVGRRVAQMVMELEPENPSVWLQVSNFYSEIGEFETSSKIKEIAVARKMQRDILHSSVYVLGAKRL